MGDNIQKNTLFPIITFLFFINLLYSKAILFFNTISDISKTFLNDSQNENFEPIIYLDDG
jgi:hypothetical protein